MAVVETLSAREAAPAAAGAPVYLDYQATTPLDPRVRAAMMPYLAECFGNPHSLSHAYGRDAEAAVEAARREIAALVGADPREIVFTSGATESNNLAIKGAARFLRAAGRGGHVVTVATEHKCVLESCRRLEREGFSLTVLPVGRDGLVDLEALADAIRDDTVLVSVMAANNEIGVLQPVAEIGALCRARKVTFHTDAAQAVGKVPVDVEAMAVDLMSISAHKLYGPKGIGALYVRRRPRVRLEPLIDGGGQERGLRSGTLATPLCVGFGAACAIARAEMADEATRLAGLRDRLLGGLRARLDGVRLNGDPARRLAGNLNLSFDLPPGATGDEGLVGHMEGIAVSTGSACTSVAVEPSYVLRALGVPDPLARASLRIGLGRFTTVADVDDATDEIARVVTALRAAAVRQAGRG